MRKLIRERLRDLSRFLNSRFAAQIPNFSLQQQRVLIVIALFILVLLYFKFYFRPSLPQEEAHPEVVVEIVGEVHRPGIQIFRKPPTLVEALERGGGLKEAAHLDETQSSELLETGTLLTVSKESPTELKITIGRMTAQKLLAFSLPLDLNRVSVEDLCLLPGIGKSLAREIVAYRERRRGFRTIEELKNVKGIGEKNYESFRPYLIVQP